MCMLERTCGSANGGEVSVLGIIMEEAAPTPAGLGYHLAPQQLPQSPAVTDS